MAKWQTIIIEKLWFIGAILIDGIDGILDDITDLLVAGAWGIVDLAGSIVSIYDKIADMISWGFSYFGIHFLRRVHNLRLEIHKYRKELIGGALYFIITGVVAIWLIAGAIDYSYAYNGKTIGIVKEQRDVLEIMDLISEELTQEYGSPIAISGDDDITFTPVISHGKEIDSVDAVLKKFTYMGDIQTKAFGIIVDGVKIGTVQSESVGQDIFEAVIKKYLKKKRSSYEYVGIVEDTKIEEVETTLGRINSKSAVLKIIDAGTLKDVSYTANAGDTIEDAAKELDAKEKDIRRLNPEISETGELMAGQVVTVQKEAPVLTVKTVGKETFAETIKYKTEIVESDQYYKDEEFVQTQGEDGKMKVIARVTRLNGELSEREDLETEVIKEVVNKVIVKGTKEKPKTEGTGTFIRPVNVAVYSGFGWRWGRMHEGIDLPAPTGTPIHAADGGTICRAGWYYGYGLCVEIDHGGGVITRYGHCSKLDVSVGDKVFQGQVIAKVGNTGHSFGSHCHFEIRINGSPVDPQKYV